MSHLIQFPSMFNVYPSTQSVHVTVPLLIVHSEHPESVPHLSHPKVSVFTPKPLLHLVHMSLFALHSAQFSFVHLSHFVPSSATPFPFVHVVHVLVNPESIVHSSQPSIVEQSLTHEVLSSFVL